MNDLAALTELKLREDNSDLIEIHVELNCATLPQSCVCVLATEIFFKNFSHEHANAPIANRGPEGCCFISLMSFQRACGNSVTPSYSPIAFELGFIGGAHTQDHKIASPVLYYRAIPLSTG